jgi:hypothetical protein
VPEYADALLVSKITSTMLVPTTYSQIWSNLSNFNDFIMQPIFHKFD